MKCEKAGKTTDDITPFNADLPEPGKIQCKGDNKYNKKTLRAMQWNAASLKNKIYELRDRTKALDLDILLIQETHLKEDDKTPTIDGYTAIRADRKGGMEGGGLISYIRTSLTFERIKDEAKNGTEISSFSVKMSKNKWIKFTNLYCPPTSSTSFTNQLELALPIIPTASNAIICGDFNAHSTLWDDHAASDERGSQIEDWLIEIELTVLNDNAPTRINPATGGLSSPNVTLCGTNWSHKTTWTTEDGMGKSDHNPIVIEMHSEVSHNPVFKGQAKWKSKNVDRRPFTEEIDAKIALLEPSTNIYERANRFTKILIDAGKAHVGTVKPGKNTKTWMTPPVRAAIRKRNHLRRKFRTQHKESKGRKLEGNPGGHRH